MHSIKDFIIRTICSLSLKINLPNDKRVEND